MTRSRMIRSQEDIIHIYQEARALEEKCHVACEGDTESSIRRSASYFKFHDDCRVLSNVQDMGHTHSCRSLKGEKAKMKAEMERVAEESKPGIFAYDDVSGAPLEAERVKKAREEEIRYFRKMGVYKKVPRARWCQLTGRAPIGVRWVDVNKQDSENPLYRSRLVANNFAPGKIQNCSLRLRH